MQKVLFVIQSQPETAIVCVFPYSFRSFASQINLLAAIAAGGVEMQVLLQQFLA